MDSVIQVQVNFQGRYLTDNSTIIKSMSICSSLIIEN